MIFSVSSVRHSLGGYHWKDKNGSLTYRNNYLLSGILGQNTQFQYHWPLASHQHHKSQHQCQVEIKMIF